MNTEKSDVRNELLDECSAKAEAYREAGKRTRLSAVIAISLTLMLGGMKLLPQWATNQLGVAIFIGVAYIATLTVLEVHSRWLRSRASQRMGEDTGSWTV